MSAIDTDDPSLDEEDEDAADTKIPVKGKLAPKSPSQEKLDKLIAKQRADALAKLARSGGAGLRGPGAGSIVDLGDGSGQGAGSVVDLGGDIGAPPPAPVPGGPIMPLAPAPPPLSHDPALARALLAQKQQDQARLQGWSNLKRDLTDPGAPPGEDPRALAASNPDRYGGINPTMRPVLPVRQQLSDSISSDNTGFPNGTGLGFHAPAPGMGTRKAQVREADLADVARQRDSLTLQAQLDMEKEHRREGDQRKLKEFEEGQTNERSRLSRESREKIAEQNRNAKRPPPPKVLTPGEQRQADQNAREGNEDKLKDLENIRDTGFGEYEDIGKDIDPLKKQTELHPSDRASNNARKDDNEDFRRTYKQTEEDRRAQALKDREEKDKAAAEDRKTKAEEAKRVETERERTRFVDRNERAHQRAIAEVNADPTFDRNSADNMKRLRTPEGLKAFNDAKQAAIDEAHQRNLKRIKAEEAEFEKRRGGGTPTPPAGAPKVAPLGPAPVAKAKLRKEKPTSFNTKENVYGPDLAGDLANAGRKAAFAASHPQREPWSNDFKAADTHEYLHTEIPEAERARNASIPEGASQGSESYPPSGAPSEDQQRQERVARLRQSTGDFRASHPDLFGKGNPPSVPPPSVPPPGDMTGGRLRQEEPSIEVDGQKTTATDLAGHLLEKQPAPMRIRELRKMAANPEPYAKRGINVQAVLAKYGG